MSKRSKKHINLNWREYSSLVVFAISRSIGRKDERSKYGVLSSGSTKNHPTLLVEISMYYKKSDTVNSAALTELCPEADRYQGLLSLLRPAHEGRTGVQ